MAQVHAGTCGGDMERSQRDMKGKAKRRRRRRRRCKGKEQGDVLSTLIDPSSHCDAGVSSAEDADSSSTSSLEVKENRDELAGELLLRRRPSAPKRKRLYRSPPGCKMAAWAAARKNALVQLNELRPGPRYEAPAETGPPHAPLFSVGVRVNGSRFEGRGPTKKQAKMRAAEAALRSFVQAPSGSQAAAGPPSDFSADHLDPCGAFLGGFELCESCDLLRRDTPKKELFSSAYSHRRVVRPPLDFSPVALLGELRPGARYTCLTERMHGRPARSFVMVVRVEGRVFEGCGRSKRSAKARAAGAALQSVYGVGLGPERTVPGLQHQLPQFFAESIFHLVEEKYSELTDGRFPSCSYKGLAAVVMTRGFDLRSSQVVSLATGTKCRDSDGGGGDREGSLSDCHAEVLSRRALVRFLYAQLELLLREPAHCEEQSVFVPNKGGGFRLRDGVLFHMYASSSPCGDARLNCPHEAAAAHPSRRFHAHLRAKVDGGEGTLPVAAPGANQKPPVIMSCTDKIAKWSVVGLQGALLSHLVEPVYLHSLTVGTLRHTGHLGRAVARRLGPVRRLPVPYRRQKLLLGCLGSSAARPAGKAPNVSASWSRGDGGLEEVSAATGRRREGGAPSRLCRRSMFARWQRLQQQLTGADAAPRTYAGSKMAAGRYQRAMQQFTGALQGGGLGTWPRNPPADPHRVTLTLN